FALRVGADDAKYLAPQFAPVFEENDLMNFDNRNGALRLLLQGESSRPFSLATLPLKKGNTETAAMLKNLSRLKYGKNRDDVESELSGRLRHFQNP
ncbi:MAG: hypothetical protein HYV78_00420, partial [Candidatus Wildermuthbacteria bacterium]|nr:hypothetical protein [Candidatus Wildermuthbacteria bacterium]